MGKNRNARIWHAFKLQKKHLDCPRIPSRLLSNSVIVALEQQDCLKQSNGATWISLHPVPFRAKHLPVRKRMVCVLSSTDPVQPKAWLLAKSGGHQRTCTQPSARGPGEGPISGQGSFSRATKKQLCKLTQWYNSLQVKGRAQKATIRPVKAPELSFPPYFQSLPFIEHCYEDPLLFPILFFHKPKCKAWQYILTGYIHRVRCSVRGHLSTTAAWYLFFKREKSLFNRAIFIFTAVTANSMALYLVPARVRPSAEVTATEK